MIQVSCAVSYSRNLKKINIRYIKQSVVTSLTVRIANDKVVYVKMIKWVTFLVLILLAIGDSKEVKQLNTAQGPVRGYKDAGDDVFVFYGIPYATAPTGPNKYKAPLPPPTWTTPFEAVNKNIICPQMENLFMANPNSTESEDCLIANIYVPDTKTNKLPVLVYVHGGAYQIGYGEFAVAKNLMREKEMIIINFNYRLGPHGFLCLGTPDVPGNAGMKDQVALLRWVQKNIASFGGNPDDVTIIGYSAGSSAVDLLMLSPMTKGLFTKVIPESGANMAAFSVQGNPLENAKAYAKLINFSGNEDDVYALEEFYKTVSKEVLHSVDLFSQKDSTFFFSPCVERDVGQEIFLDDAPLNILKDGKQYKLPMLYGFAEMEGLFRIPYFDFWKDGMNAKFSDFLPGDLHFDSESEKEEVAERIKKFYFGNRPVSEETILRYVDYFTDIIFAYPTLRSVRLQVESGNNNIYLYQYDYVDDSAPLIPYTEVRGANHCAQTYGIVDGAWPNLTEDKLPEDTQKMKRMMRKIWASFITTGKPVPENSDHPQWPPTKANGGPHMCIDKYLKLRGPLLQQRVLFWDEIYDKYYDVPKPPPTPPKRQKEEL
ncbi:PREDICTED: para-nitrobenzyl esterase-like [Papilio xuthus]|uniref:Carboxylic ester hydrolase n=1 Tax=Papilio xuthus TaxID=66420 RepID=A0AAJ7E8K6_PAPXU|nr:PREDICTED: para-nitrobenzyl esterase-like [Papilio xuthus]